MRNDDGDKHNPQTGSGDSLLVGYVLNIMWEVYFFVWYSSPNCFWVSSFLGFYITHN